MLSSSELVSWDQEKGRWHRPEKEDGERGGRGGGRGRGGGGGGRKRRGEGRGRRGTRCVSAHRPFLSRQTGTLKHSHTCICLCLALGARTPTTLSWQLHERIK